jgi:hypothetical protein
MMSVSIPCGSDLVVRIGKPGVPRMPLPMAVAQQPAPVWTVLSQYALLNF